MRLVKPRTDGGTEFGDDSPAVPMKTRLFVVLSMVILAGPAQASTAKKPKATPAKSAQPSSLVVESPKPGSQVSGVVTIVVRSAEKLQQVAVSVPGATHAMLSPMAGDPTRWEGKLDSTLIPNGEAQVLVSSNVRTAKATLPMKVSNPDRLYFGDLHAHSISQCRRIAHFEQNFMRRVG